MKSKFLLFGLLFGLVSCNNALSPLLSRNSSFASVSSSMVTSSFESIPDQIVYDENAVLDSYTLENFERSEDYNRAYLSSKGSPKILVLPVLFEDSVMDKETQEKVRADLNDTFFGESEDTNWESVRSFYQKSSYQQLLLEGEVAPFVQIDMTVQEVASLSRNENPYSVESNAYYDNSYYPLMKGIEILKDQMDLSEFDTNNDGYIDACWVIYGEKTFQDYLQEHNIRETNPNYENIQNFLWAYTYWYMGNSSSDMPIPRTYSFASYYSMYEEETEKVDAHTYIHETGHMLGLEDYYNYDYGSFLSGRVLSRDYTKPTGGPDMMDYNVGDHNAYSKYLLGWIEPKIVVREGKYTMESFQKNGDCLIVPAGEWNGTPYQEYLIIEYYVKEGLNYKDASRAYKGVYPLLFQTSGFKIYHVDARLGIYNRGEIRILDDPRQEGSSRGYFLGMMNSNTPSRSIFGILEDYDDAYDARLITLLSATGRNTFYNGANRWAQDQDLFQNGDSIESFTFNNEKELPFKISFSSCNATSGEITFSL